MTKKEMIEKMIKRCNHERQLMNDNKDFTELYKLHRTRWCFMCDMLEELGIDYEEITKG